jgi:hypothetical protein
MQLSILHVQIGRVVLSESSTLAFPDPIPTQTVNSVTYDLTRIGLGDSKGVFRTANGLDRLTIEHTLKNRARHVIRLDRLATVADPLTTGNNFEASMSTYVVVDMPRVGFDATAADWHWKLLKSIMDEGTPDYSLRFLRGEV